MRKTITLILILSSLHGFAQKSSITFLSRVEPSKGVHLKWYNNPLYSTEEYYLERKVGNGKYERLNTTAFGFDKTPQPNGEGAKTLSEAAKSQPYISLDGFTQLTFFLQVTKDNELAKYFGMYFWDKTAPKEQLSYRLLNKQEKEIAKLSVDASDPKVPLPPKGFTITAGNKKMLLNLTVENARFYAYDIYRSKTEAGTYIKLTDEPILASISEDAPQFYEDKAVEVGETYNYKAIGLDYFGMPSTSTKVLSATVIDKSAPVVPELIRIKSGEKSILLSWELDPKKIDHLNLYRSYKDESNFELLNDSPLAADLANFEDQPTAAGLYYYKLEAVGKNGKKSLTKSNFGEMRDFTAPDAPQGLKIKAESGKLTLSWNQNTEGDFMGYWVYRTVTPDSKMFSLLTNDPISTSTIEDELPKKAKNAFRYYVVALDTNENISEKSEVVIGRMPDVTPPTAPFLSAIAEKDGKVVLGWQAVSSADLKNYQLLRTVDNSTDTIASLARDKVSYEDDAPKNKELSYQLIAVDSADNYSAPSNILTHEIKEIKAATAVEAFEIVLNEEEKKADISWGTLDDVKGYIVYRKKTSDKNWKPISELLTTSTFSDNDLKKENQYSYQIRTYATNGQVAVSPVKNVSLP